MRRRDLIKGAAAVPFCFGPQAWAAVSDESRGRLIVILLRGAVDGLNVVIPCADEAYYRERPSIAIAPPGKPDGALALDGHFGLHPALASLMPLWTERRLAFIHAAGSPDSTRSHFDAQLYIENGTPGQGTDARRLDEPPAVGASRAARSDRRDQHRPDRAAHPGGQGPRSNPAARPQRRPAVADRSAGDRQCLRSALFRQ